ncbi:hypothetical protein SAMN05421734_10957 [Pelagirhabdus alkalitolerans]|uniref:Uncharacterized protein n=1 Tax=Pelagirhabdus alkalitolerans TaxID=1612202 RepID=A0A1G6LT73_9BACI|nr:NusG domain II-containing protein [Pelagirhabdus alkalitolerans]SDC46297.1 hypothetical protein SAMN05421734_10957 [Pelagirhabdus alkalitolerans]
MKLRCTISDIVLIALLLILSFTPLFIFSNPFSSNQALQATVQVDQTVVDEIDLSGVNESKMIEVPEIKCNDEGIEIDDNAVRVRKSDCPEQICVRTGFIASPGEAIICLPHRVVIEITSNDSSIDDVISY